MSQNAEEVLDHFNLFRGPEYTEMFKNKREKFEDRASCRPEVERVTRVAENPRISREELRPRSSGDQPRQGVPAARRRFRRR